MMRRYRATWSLLLMFSLAAGAVAKTPVVGQPAPNFTATTVDGKKLTLADFKGQVLVLNFWATWCVPCRKELPLLNAYFTHQQIHGLRVLTVTTENSAPMSALKPVAEAVSFPMVRYLHGPYEPMVGVPTNYIIDRNGTLVYARAGAFELDDLNALLVPLLQEPAPMASPASDAPTRAAE